MPIICCVHACMLQKKHFVAGQGMFYQNTTSSIFAKTAAPGKTSCCKLNAWINRTNQGCHPQATTSRKTFQKASFFLKKNAENNWKKVHKIWRPSMLNQKRKISIHLISCGTQYLIASMEPEVSRLLEKRGLLSRHPNSYGKFQKFA